jgi:hypothetical protein
MLAVPSKTSNNEKNTLIARTAITSSVAFLSIYEYQFQMPGIKKCHIPKPIEIMLPIVVRIFIRVFFTSSLCFVGCTLPKVV